MLRETAAPGRWAWKPREKIEGFKMRGWSILGIMAATAGVFGCAELDPERRANTFEFGYEDIAEARRDPALCHKIAPDAHSMTALSTRGNQVSLVRSNCFYGVAVERRDPTLCDEVHPINTWLLDGSANNPEACRAAVEHARASRHRPVTGLPQEVELFLGVLGYDVSDEVRPATEDRFLWYRKRYRDVARTPEFTRRLERLPDFSRGDDEARRQLDALLPQCRDGGADWLCQAVESALTRND